MYNVAARAGIIVKVYGIIMANIKYLNVIESRDKLKIMTLLVEKYTIIEAEMAESKERR